MFFHSSTTVWHQSNTNISAKERRVVYGVWGSLKSFGNSVIGAGQGLYSNTISAVTSKPVRMAYAPFFWAYEGYKKAKEYTIDKLKLGAHTAFEAGKSVVGTRQTIMRSLFEYIPAPVARPIYHLLIENTRDVLKGIVDLGGKTLSGAGSLALGLLKAPLLPFKLINSTRKKVSNVIFSPIETAEKLYESTNSFADAVWEGVAHPIASFKKGRDYAKDKVSGGLSNVVGFSTIPRDVKNNIIKTVNSPVESFKAGGDHMSGAWTKFKGSYKRAKGD